MQKFSIYLGGHNCSTYDSQRKHNELYKTNSSLLELSDINSPIMRTLLHILYVDYVSKVILVGEYSQQSDRSHGILPLVYEDILHTKPQSLEFKEFDISNKICVCLQNNEYIDLDQNYEGYFPLPLLLAYSQGKGNGDYITSFTPIKKRIGSWCGKTIQVLDKTKNVLDYLTEVGDIFEK